MWNQIQRGRILAAATLAAMASTHATWAATTVTWNGSTSTDFEVGANWNGGSVPANDTTTNTALFTGAVTANLPQLTASRSVNSVQFGSGGWSFGSSSSANVLTLGTSGVFASSSTGTNTVSANLAITPNTGTLTNVTFGSGTSTVGTSQLNLIGSLSVGSSATPNAYALVFGSTTRRDTVSLSPSVGNSVAIYTNGVSGQASLNTGSAGTLILGGDAGNTNILSNSASAGIKYATGTLLQVVNGTWLTNDIGSNNSGQSAGTVEISGGTLATGGARYLVQANGTMVVDGGTFKVTGGGNVVSSSGYFKLGANAASTTLVSTFNVTSGTVDIAKTSGGTSQIGDLSSGVFNQDGGAVRVGVTSGSNVFTGATNGNTASDLIIGSTTSGISGAYTMTGGTLTVAGTIRGQTTPGGVSNFNFKGGTLAARGVDVTTLGSNSAATFSGSGLSAAGSNQIAASNNIGTLENYGGTIAPGGDSSAGLMTLTGNYAGNGNGSTLSFDLGGTTSAAAFVGGAGTFDNITVSGATALNDVLSVNLLAGFTPANSDTFTILASTGPLTGAFSNVAFGGTLAVAGGSFTVSQQGNSVVLSNFTAVPEPATLSAMGLLGILALKRRRLV